MNLFILDFLFALPGWLEHWDRALFFKINTEWHNGFLDSILPLIREQNFWIPFYLFLILFATINFGAKGWMWVGIFIAMALLSDYISSDLIKGNFFRLRPCQDPSMADKMRFIVAYCPVSSSFTSSHAFNHFSAAMYIFITLKVFSKYWYFIFAWALAIIYAQVYVGVHFPVDVIAGAIFGMILGFVTGWVFNRYVGWAPRRKL